MKEEQKVRGAVRTTKVDPSTLLNAEFSNKRVAQLQKPGSRLFKPAFPRLPFSILIKYLWDYDV